MPPKINSLYNHGMPAHHEPSSHVIAEFRVRFRRQLVLSAGVLVLVVPVIMERENLGQTPLRDCNWMMVWVALMFAAAGYSFWNWRCPACSRYLGRALFIRACSQCGAKLKE